MFRFPARRWALLPVFWLVAAILVSCPAEVAAAEDFIVSRAVLIDPTGTLGIDEVSAAHSRTAFKPAQILLARGYTPDVHWLRIAVRSPPESNGNLVLRIQPLHLDDLRLFERTASGWSERISGDRHPFVERETQDAAFAFVIHPNDVNGGIFYLRMQTTTASVLHVLALRPSDAAVAADRYSILTGIYGGFVLTILWWAGMQYWLTRSPLVTRFALYQTVMLSLGLGLMGGLSKYFFPVTPLLADALTSVLSFLATASTIWFHQKILWQYSPPRWFDRLMKLFLCAFPLELLAMVTGHTQQGLQLNALVALCLATALVVVTAFLPRRSKPVWTGLVVTYVVGWLAIFPLLLVYLGVGIGSEWVLYSVIIHNPIAALLLALLLATEFRHTEEHYRQALSDSRLAVERAEWDRQQREMQSRFIDMLTHELRAALSVVCIAGSSLRRVLTERAPEALPRLNSIDLAVDDMSALIERCIRADKIDQGEQDLDLAPCSLHDTLLEIIKTTEQAKEAAGRIKLRKVAQPDVLADPKLLHVMLTNLIDNALKYSPAGTPIQAELVACHHEHRPGMEVVITNEVAPGEMPEAALLFTRYYRSLQAHALTGTGLGLFLVSSLAKMHHGQARACIGDDGCHISFIVWLPTSSHAAVPA